MERLGLGEDGAVHEYETGCDSQSECSVTTVGSCSVILYVGIMGHVLGSTQSMINNSTVTQSQSSHPHRDGRSARLSVRWHWNIVIIK